MAFVQQSCDGASSTENGLRQKLTALENAAARLASIKAHLKANADQVRKEMNSAVSHQLSLIRSREQELMNNLDLVVSQKETVLARQQEIVNQSLGACRQVLQCLRESGDQASIDANNVLLRMSTLDLSPRENADVRFVVDSMQLRAVISKFGKITSDKEKQIKSGVSLPVEVEDYDDDVGMVHKSVLRISASHSNPNIEPPTQSLLGTPTPSSHSVHNWLTRMASGPTVLNTDVVALRREYEQNVRNLHSSANSTSGSSFEVVGKSFSGEFLERGPLPDEMKQLLRRPADEWLLYRGLGSSMNSTVRSQSPPANMRHRLSISPPEYSENDDGIAPCEYEFQTVISEVQNSDNSQWLLVQNPTTSSACEIENKMPVLSPIPTVPGSLCANVGSKSSSFKVPHIFPENKPKPTQERNGIKKPCNVTSFDDVAFIRNLQAMFNSSQNSKA